MSKIFVIICTFLGALFLMYSCVPNVSSHTAGTFAGYSISWAMLVAVIAVMFAWKMKA